MTRTSTIAAMLSLLMLCLLPLVSAHIIHVGASVKECFFEDLNENDKVPASVS
jgi:hypothetical protein